VLPHPSVPSGTRDPYLLYEGSDPGRELPRRAAGPGRMSSFRLSIAFAGHGAGNVLRHLAHCYLLVMVWCYPEACRDKHPWKSAAKSISVCEGGTSMSTQENKA